MLPVVDREPREDLVTLEHELGRFSEKLLERRRLVVANKMDLSPEVDSMESVRAECRSRGLALFEISAVTGAGVQPLLRTLEALVSEIDTGEPVVSGPHVTYTAAADDGVISVHRVGERFVVEGRGVERIVLMTDMKSEEARFHMASRLRRAGVEGLLEREGARAGDEVEIAGTVFEYVPGGRDRRRRERCVRRGGRRQTWVRLDGWS